MASLKFGSEELESMALAIRGCREKHISAISELNSIVDALGDEWNSTAKTNFVNGLNEMKSTFVRFSIQMEEMAEELQALAREERIPFLSDPFNLF